MEKRRLEELLLQSLEHEQGGVKVYEIAVKCAVNRDLQKEWREYLEQTRRHVAVLEKTCAALGIDAKRETPGRQIVRHVGAALVEAMNLALAAGDRNAAEIVASECVVLAETKDHMDWALIGKCAKHSSGSVAAALQKAYDEIEDEEDEHLYHTRGWCRELWLASLGMNAVVPPLEERQNVRTAIGAARAEVASEKAR
jgi:hypothetical protein